MNSLSAEASIIVTAQDTASRIALAPTDSFPEVFATSRMIALMELAAARAIVDTARLISGAERRRKPISNTQGIQ